MSLSRYKLVFFSPRTNTRDILDKLFHMFPNNLGRIGKYEHCAFITPGTGQFRPGEGANPVTGSIGQVESVEEDRVELLVCDEGGDHEIESTIKELKRVHPYEEVAYDVYRLEKI